MRLVELGNFSFSYHKKLTMKNIANLKNIDDIKRWYIRRFNGIQEKSLLETALLMNSLNEYKN